MGVPQSYIINRSGTLLEIDFPQMEHQTIAILTNDPGVYVIRRYH